MIDRCSRIKYFKEYTGMSEELIDSILANNLEGDPRINDVKDIIVNKFAVTSFDNISSFVKEVKNFLNGWFIPGVELTNYVIEIDPSQQ